jgi:hypothetical protein
MDGHEDSLSLFLSLSLSVLSYSLSLDQASETTDATQSRFHILLFKAFKRSF